MKNKYFVYMLAAVLLGVLAQTVSAQQGEIGFANGINVIFQVEKTGENQTLSNMFSSSGTDENIVHRVMIDRKNKLYVISGTDENIVHRLSAIRRNEYLKKYYEQVMRLRSGNSADSRHQTI